MYLHQARGKSSQFACSVIFLEKKNGFFAVGMVLVFARVTTAAQCFVPVSALEKDCFASCFSDILPVGPTFRLSKFTVCLRER